MEGVQIPNYVEQVIKLKKGVNIFTGVLLNSVRVNLLLDSFVMSEMIDCVNQCSGTHMDNR